MRANVSRVSSLIKLNEFEFMKAKAFERKEKEREKELGIVVNGQSNEKVRPIFSSDQVTTMQRDS